MCTSEALRNRRGIWSASLSAQRLIRQPGAVVSNAEIFSVAKVRTTERLNSAEVVHLSDVYLHVAVHESAMSLGLEHPSVSEHLV